MDGIILINKEKGMTSHDVVSKIRKKFNIKKVGHAGTLDPLATGLLIILVGRATKLSDELMNHNKTYVAKLKLGEKRSTGDLEGEVIEEKDIPVLDNAKIEKVLKSFLGKQLQTPPMYSAIKINGKKLYEYARSGEKVEIPPKEIEIFDIQLLNFENAFIDFEVSCSKGTYIRTLCEDIAEKLGTVGAMADLKRICINEFNIDNAVKIDEVSENSIIPIDKIKK